MRSLTFKTLCDFGTGYYFNVLFRYGDWIQGPGIAEEYKRKGHCAVQINSCEGAILGGVTDDTTFRDDIVIFNFEDAKWKQGPRYTFHARMRQN